MVEDTKERIRAVALALFTTHGYEQTSLREIADRVGITKASLYYHHPSKQALLIAIVEPLLTEWRMMVERLAAAPHTPEHVRDVLGECLDTMLRHRDACALFARDVPALLTAVGPILVEAKELGTRMNAWLAGPDPSLADRVRAFAATEVLNSALASAVMLPSVPQDELRATLLDAAAAVLGLPRTEPAPGRPGG
ncbi:TetR/AcrR family transcriptional regulator [Plantactinospora soyae]|uniref:AcrR family transcriptional regulator n=1 Tax=Plantactinospora soyae TaxID=1544732 RepID=A0A927R2B0_9ACTN|nr:TetR/AcrR family transcriptional regulator [Plantactinospora soyae]MBE1484379.1 AcrR family transcriptional regulator [Plantactinospora soyae]